MRKLAVIIICIPVLFSCSRIEISGDEKQLLLSEKAFSEYGYSFPDAPQGKYTKFRLPDGAIEMTYIYKGYAKDSSYLNISNMITIDKSRIDAEDTYLTKAKSVNLSKVSNSKLQKIEGFGYGDDSVLYLWLTNDQPVGNYFLFRMNNITYQLFFQGFYFADSESWSQFFTHKIEPSVKTLFGKN